MVTIPAFIDNKPNPDRKNLIEMLNNTTKTPTPVRLKNILPKFLKVTNRGTAKPYSLMKPVPGKIFKQTFVQCFIILSYSR